MQHPTCDRTEHRIEKEEQTQVDHVLDLTQMKPTEWRVYSRTKRVFHVKERQLLGVSFV